MDFTTVGKKVVYKSKRGRLEGIVKDEVFVEDSSSDRDFVNLVQYISSIMAVMGFGSAITLRIAQNGEV